MEGGWDCTQSPLLFLTLSYIMELILTNQSTKKQYSHTVEDKGDKELYYELELVLNEPVGEYSYQLIDGDVLSEGLLRIEKDKENKVSYNNNKTYTTYERK